MDRFFSKFPTITYNNYTCTDISRSVRFTNSSKQQASLYYPIEIDAGFRADNLADAYYEDAEMDWMIWLANDIVDPYYEWYLSEQEFDAFIQDKYGSYEDAVKKIAFYRTNWFKFDETITPSFHDNTLLPVLKKYYSPVFGNGNKIVSYKRKNEDWFTNTNQIIQYDVITSNPFIVGEIVDLKYNGETIGGGEVLASNTSAVTIQHVSGNTYANTTWPKNIIGESSGIEVTSSNSLTLAKNFDEYEAIYWDSVNYYDLEVEANENRKNLVLINSEYATDISEQIRIKLKE